MTEPSDFQSIAYDGSGNDVEVVTRLQHIRCWRCWRLFQVPTGSGDQETAFLYHCNRCGSERGVDGDDYQKCFWRYIKKLRADGKPIIQIRQNLYRQFDRGFQKHWFPKCSCGGGFKARFLRPVPRCSHCGIRNLGWLPWPIDEDPAFLKVPALIYRIPPTYQRFDTSVPSWLLNKPQELRTEQERKKEGNFLWMLRLLALLLVGFIACIYSLVYGFYVGISRVFGFLTGTHKQKPRKIGKIGTGSP